MNLTRNFKNLIVLTATMLFAQSVLAENPPAPVKPAAECTILRTAKTTVTLNKQFWVQDSGIWVQKTAKIAQVNPLVPVFKESTAGCTIPKALELDNLNLNGVTETIRLYAFVSIQEASLHPTPNKVFTATYFLSSDTGRTAYASAFTPDLTVKSMGVSFNKERASSSTSAHEDTINVVVNFNDDAAE